jgi:hypothetical protein
LHLVQDELVTTIETAARDLEVFVQSEQEDPDALQSSIDNVQQIIGILKVLELKSSVELADELLKVLNDVTSGVTGDVFEQKMEVVSGTFFILTRYLEYIQQVEHQVPVLLVPHINALRKLRRQEPILESHFLAVGVPRQFSIPDSDYDTSNSTALARTALRRCRQMYQIGLLGFIREKQVKSSLALMRRSARKLLNLSGKNAPLSKLWWLLDKCLNVIYDASMSPLDTRKFLLMRVDRILRQVEVNGRKAFEAEPPSGVIKELIYLLAISGVELDGKASVLSKAIRTLDLPYNEAGLQKEYSRLYGPSAHTISSLSHVLQTELISAKRTLENAAQSELGTFSDIDSFIAVLANIAEILGVVGLGAASDSLREQVSVVETWEKTPSLRTADSIAKVAETILYVESLVRNLQSTDLHDSDSGVSPDGEQHAQVASSELGTAIEVVIEEAMGSLSLTKRAINSFSDSNYDTGHIRNIAKTLNSVRGAMLLLGKDRVAGVLDACADFVEGVLLDRDPPAAIDEVLETFADAIIAVEYYFDSGNGRLSMDESVLAIAEDSLSALGFDF